MYRNLIVFLTNSWADAEARFSQVGALRKDYCSCLKSARRRSWGKTGWQEVLEQAGTRTEGRGLPEPFSQRPRSRREGCGQATRLFKVSEVGLLRLRAPQKWPACNSYSNLSELNVS